MLKSLDRLNKLACESYFYWFLRYRRLTLVDIFLLSPFNTTFILCDFLSFLLLFLICFLLCHRSLFDDRILLNRNRTSIFVGIANQAIEVLVGLKQVTVEYSVVRVDLEGNHLLGFILSVPRWCRSCKCTLWPIVYSTLHYSLGLCKRCITRFMRKFLRWYKVISLLRRGSTWGPSDKLTSCDLLCL
jgi:hypothetical protein